MRFRTPAATVLATTLVLLPTAAHAGGSDSPTPYTVTADGLTLPVGTAFEENGHINYKVTALDGSGTRSFNVQQSLPHNGVWPRGQYVGASYYPWKDHPDFLAAFPAGYCVTWVQVSLFNEHFGEGGQAPVCTDSGEPTDLIIPTDPTGPLIPTDPTGPTDRDDPTDPGTPTGPTGPDPTDPADPTEPTDPLTPTDPVDTVQPAEPAAPTEPELISEVLAAEPSDASGTGTLAATGLPVAAVGALGALAIAAGACLVVAVRRRIASGEN